MDKNAIKKYAVWARQTLLERISQRAEFYGITEGNQETLYETKDDKVINGNALNSIEFEQRRSLIERIKDKGYKQVIEEVAYTWFNRFIALRFMEVNNYLPVHVRIFTDENNNFKPQILDEALNIEIDDLDKDKVYELKNASNNEDLFQYLLIAQCNALHAILPEMFQKIKDYTMLLCPNNLLREDSVIQRLVTDIPEEDWKDNNGQGQIQIIGWLYQYYNSELKEKVFADLKKNIKITKEKIPAATQLFTPDWIVRYMVENSLGRLWLEGHPNDELRSKWKYYIDEAEQEEEVKVQLDKIREEYKNLDITKIKFIDPCMGSGHILVYAFEVFMQIYDSLGYNQREAAALILKNNLYGLDIDDRAFQLAYFSLFMKAMTYDKRILRRGIELNLCAIQESNGLKSDSETEELCKTFEDAKYFGSLIDCKNFDDIDLSQNVYIDVMNKLVKQARILSGKYDVVVTNPPYMNSSNMADTLLNFLKDNFYDYKSDLFSACMIKFIKMTKNGGHLGFMTSNVWMFITSYQKLRKYILDKKQISSFVHMGKGSFFREATVDICAFILNNFRISNKNSCYFKLPNCSGGLEVQRQKFLEVIESHDKQIYFETSTENFSKIPGSPIAYWVSDNLLSIFKQKNFLDDVASPKKGLVTTDNDRFLRFWYEVFFDNVGINCKDRDIAKDSKKKWFPLNKGGQFRRWYGNKNYLINWLNDGEEIKQVIIKIYHGSYTKEIRNEDKYFQNSITWSALTSNVSSFRFSDYGAIFDSAGSSMFPQNTIYYILGLLNTKVIDTILKIINPTLNYGAGTISKIPLIISDDNKDQIEDVVGENILISRNDWDSFETSWDFQSHPLIGTSNKISETYAQFKQTCEERFITLKHNEEELNRIFIDIYGLTDELTPEVADKDVTVARIYDTKDEIPETMNGNNYVLTKADVIKSLISYAVGCMFGRYSLDVPGLAFAGGDWDSSKYSTFTPCKHAVIPICDDEYFDDDIITLFVKFIEAAYGKDTLEENLRYIAEALGGSGTSREIIRKYFLKGFYEDHVATYKKRPIYWLFDSGKNNGFKCLIYMHRYQFDTIAHIRTDYVHEQQSRYHTIIEDLEQRISKAATSERVKLQKRLKIVNEQAEELRKYEEKIHHLADQMIRIDLDDGVKKNYAIFQDVLAKIK